MQRDRDRISCFYVAMFITKISKNTIVVWKVSQLMSELQIIIVNYPAVFITAQSRPVHIQ